MKMGELAQILKDIKTAVDEVWESPDIKELRQKLKNKIDNMTPEEKTAWLERVKKRFEEKKKKC